MSATDRHAKAAELRRENERLREERNAGITTNAELLEHIGALQTQLDISAQALAEAQTQRDEAREMANSLYTMLVTANGQLLFMGRCYQPIQDAIDKYLEWRKE